MSTYSKFGTFVLVVFLVMTQGLFGQEFTPPKGSPLAKKEHPRLFFTDESLQEIKQYIDTYEAAAFQQFVNEVDAAFLIDPVEKNRNLLLLDAKSFSFLCYASASGMFSNYTFGYSPKEYANKAYAHTVEIDKQKRKTRKWLKEKDHAAIMESPSQGGYINLALGVVYDWCFDQLSAEQKRTLADALYLCFQKRDDEVDADGKNKLGLTLTSQCHDVGIGGLATWGDNLGAKYDAQAKEMLDGIQWLWYDRILHQGERLFEGTAGWSEGANYFSGAVTNLVWYLSALSTAVGENVFTKFKWLRDIPLYTFFYALPMKVEGRERGYFQQRNDAASLREWETMGTLKQMMPIASLIKKEEPLYAGFYKWVVEESRMKITNVSLSEEGPRVMWLFYKFLWGYKDIAVKTPAEAGIQTSYRFGLGDAIFLSDLYSDDATKINFYTPKYHLSRHYNQDNGSFVLFKHGTLAVDAGVSKGDTHLPKSEKTGNPIFHNLLALQEPDGHLFYRYSMKTHDRSSSYKDRANTDGGRNHVGTVVSQRFEKDRFDFIDYDYTRSYKGEKYARRIRRALLYLRDPNAPTYNNEEYVVVVDDVFLNRPQIKKRWLLHTPVMPELLDGKWDYHGKGHWTAEEGSSFSATNTHFNSHGRLFVKVMAPANVRLTMRGGNDGNTYYWFTDSEGNISHERGPYTDWGAFWAGTHRLEIEDARDDSLSQYFVVMQLGDSNTMAKMAPVNDIGNENYFGALINQNRAVLINKTMGQYRSLSYRIKSGKKVWHFISGLLPGKYTVTRDGKKITSVEAASDGILFFEQSGGGKFSVDKQ